VNGKVIPSIGGIVASHRTHISRFPVKKKLNHLTNEDNLAQLNFVGKIKYSIALGIATLQNLT